MAKSEPLKENSGEQVKQQDKPLENGINGTNGKHDEQIDVRTKNDKDEVRFLFDMSK